MEITRVKIGLSDDERIKAYATITIDDCFVIQGLRLTHSEKGYFLFMPGKKRADGTYAMIRMERRYQKEWKVAGNEQLKSYALGVCVFIEFCHRASLLDLSRPVQHV